MALIFVLMSVYLRRKQVAAVALLPGGTAFITQRTPELVAALKGIGIDQPRVGPQPAVTVGPARLELWGPRSTITPFVTVPWGRSRLRLPGALCHFQRWKKFPRTDHSGPPQRKWPLAECHCRSAGASASPSHASTGQMHSSEPSPTTPTWADVSRWKIWNLGSYHDLVPTVPLTGATTTPDTSRLHSLIGGGFRMCRCGGPAYESP